MRCMVKRMKTSDIAVLKVAIKIRNLQQTLIWSSSSALQILAIFELKYGRFFEKLTTLRFILHTINSKLEDIFQINDYKKRLLFEFF